MRFKYFTDYKYSRLHYGSATDDAFLISKPVDVTPLLPRLAKMKAICVEFDKTAFKKDFDGAKFLEQLLVTPSFEMLDIQRGNGMKKLPEIIAKQPLRYFRCDSSEIEDFSNVLPELVTLEELQLSFNKASLGNGIAKLKQLTKLRVSAKEVTDLDSICSLVNLEYLSLRIEHLSSLPRNLNNLTKLKYLEITNCNLTSLDALHFPDLNVLRLESLPNLRGIPDTLLKADKLEGLSLSRLKHKPFSVPAIIKLPSLVELSISDVAFNSFPEMDVPNLVKLNLQLIPVKTIFDKIKNASQVEDISLTLPLENDDISLLASKKVKSYNGPVFSSSGLMDFKIWPELNQAWLSNSGNARFNILDNILLTKVKLSDAYIETIDRLPANITDLEVSSCLKLRTISITSHYTMLQSLSVQKNPELVQLDVDGTVLPRLRYVHIRDNAQLTILKPALLLSAELHNIHTDNNTRLIDNEVESVSSLLEYLAKNNVSVEEKEAIAFWLFKNYTVETPTLKNLKSSLSLMRLPNDVVFKLITKNLAYFNDGRKPLSAYTLNELEGKSFGIAGNTFASKTITKDAIRNLKGIYTANLNEAAFILVGKKIEGDVPIGSGQIFFSEAELNQYLDVHQPKFLKQESVTEDDLANLRRILWSTNPETELMALEMLKNGGLPDEVIGECIAIAKTSSDKRVKDKYKSFLKGKVSEEAFRLVSKNIRFDLSDPFFKLAREFSGPLLGKLAMALYQRTKTLWNDVLNFHNDDFELRRQIIIDHVVPVVLEKPHYVSLYVKLTPEELKMILTLPELKGVLKRLHISTSGETLPDELSIHTTLKELVLSGNFSSIKFPEVVFALKKLNIIKIISDEIVELGEGISDLKELKEIFIYNKKSIRLPAALRDLPKLKRAYFSGGVDDAANWNEFFNKH